MPELHLQQLSLVNFKNYESQVFDFSSKLNCIVGLNGMGKTNLLDAIYYLCMCKSNFSQPDVSIQRHEADFFRLEGHFNKNKQQEKLVAKVANRKKKQIERNGTAYTLISDHIGFLPVVMIIPDDTILATSGSTIRRKFLDNTLSQLDQKYLNHLISYNKIVKQRNVALKQFSRSGRFDASLLDTYDQQMRAPAQYIFEQRKVIIEQLRPFFNEYYQIISGNREEVDCVYESQLNSEDFAQLQLDSREKDRILQRTTIGTHKDDLAFEINGYALKRFASQGQLKSFILALKLAQYEILKFEKKVRPIILLDDIFDKLDDERVKHIIGLLIDRQFGQIFITDTHQNRLEMIVKQFNSHYKTFRIAEGTGTLVNEHL